MIKDLSISKEDLLQQVIAERSEWYNYVNSKRQKFRDRLALYNNISWWDKKIYARLIYTVMQTLLWISYQDEVSVQFSWRQLQDDDLADNIQNLAEFDRTEMNLDKINYYKEWDRLSYWVWIRILDHWDDKKRVPVWKNVDPISWIPDPYWDVNSQRYHWFELEVSKWELNPNTFENIDKIELWDSSDSKEDRNVFNTTRNLNDSNKKETENNSYKIYNHYTTVVDKNWNVKKYLVTLANNLSLIIRAEEIQAVTKAEKEDPNSIPYPIALNYYSPLRWDPFWVSIPDLLEDKQKAEQLFLNLNRIKAENEAWWDIFLYDSSSIKNINELKTPTQWPKYLKADLRNNPNPIQEVRKSQVKNDSIQIPQLIQQQSHADLWLDARSLWVWWWKNITATENQRVQQNANIRLLLGNKINQWWEKDFWKLWFRAYKEYFKPTDKKNILLNNAFWNTIYTVKLTDISTSEDINITVINKSDKDSLDEQERLWFMATAPMILQDPTTPTISKAFAKRKMFKLNWIDKDEVMIMVPPSIEEMKAMEDIELLNMNEEVWDIDDMDEDHLTYIYIYKRALDTDAKRKAISARQKAYILSWQKNTQQVEWSWEWVTNAVMSNWAAQTQSKMLNSWEAQATSLQDV